MLDCCPSQLRLMAELLYCGYREQASASPDKMSMTKPQKTETLGRQPSLASSAKTDGLIHSATGINHNQVAQLFVHMLFMPPNVALCAVYNSY